MKSKILMMVILFFAMTHVAHAQKKKSTTPKKATTEKVQKKRPPTPAPVKQSDKPAPISKGEQVKHEQKVRDMVAFFEYVLNMLGSKETETSEKDVLVTDSYQKIFRDAKVQVEDDLVEKRNVVTNKNVQAYLKDVDFFFTDVKFELHIASIEASESKNGVLFYKVNLTRNMKGMTVEGKAVNNTAPRFIEINYDEGSQDLKIVSIYTNVVDERDALAQWWNQLSYEWQTVFKKRFNLGDSLTAEDIQDVVAVDTLDLSKNRYIRNFEPLSQLTSLRVLNVSNTTIADLSPFRNLTELVSLNLSGTRVADLSSLRYSDKLVRLNLNNTLVADLSLLEKLMTLQSLEIRAVPAKDLSVLAKLQHLQNLNASKIDVADFSFLSSLSQMQTINLSHTMIADLKVFKSLPALALVDLDSTPILTVADLSGLKSLRTIHINYTGVKDLSVLKDCPALEKVYCDGTGIDHAQADSFMSVHKGVLVVYDTEDLKAWWDSLPAQWQRSLRIAARTGIALSKEDLATVTNLDSINIADNINIQDLQPLQKLPGLSVVVANRTSIHDLTPLQYLKKLRYLDVSQTQVSDISPIASSTTLKVLKADKTPLQTIDALGGIESLSKLYIDENNFTDAQVRDFLKIRPKCLVIYKTAVLDTWWKALSDDWKGIFKVQTPIRTNNLREDLHQLVEREAIHFSDVPVNDLNVLKTFVQLKSLYFSGTTISDLTPLETAQQLTSLHAVNSPIRNLAPVRNLVALEDLDISNTPVENIEHVAALFDLRKFNCAGTQVDDLRPLEKLQKLEVLDCSNSNVKKLDPVEGTLLKVLKCYNTKVSDRKIEDFKKLNPQCQVVYYR
jgi:Leucine-rich repeat (LRR) protein